MVKDDPGEQDLSDDIKFRLWLARQLALMKASGYDLKTRVTGFSFGDIVIARAHSVCTREVGV